MGYDTWPKDAYKYVGGTNNWGEFSIDEKRGIVYFPLGSPTYDFYGADRLGPTFSLIACLRWMPALESTSGISRRRITIFGTMTWRQGRS